MSGGPGAEEAEPIKVVHLLHTVAYGGVETVLLNWIQGHGPDRFRPVLVCFANPGGSERPFVQAARARGLEVRTVPWGRRKPFLRAARALARILREERADILHTHNWYADMLGALTARLYPVRTVTTLYVWFDYDWRRNVLQKIDQYVIRTFDRITAHCETTRQGTIARGIPADRVETLISGFEARTVSLTPEERSRRRREHGVEDDDVLLVNVARLYPEKAHDLLLPAYQRIREACPRTKLWIAGVGPLEPELRALCTGLGLDDSVRWVGFAEDLPELLALADIQVHPAHTEGVPLALCQGMASELPIVASDAGGISEIVRPGETGVLVRGLDGRRFADAVVELIRSPDEARLLAKGARHFIENDFSLEAAVGRLERTYAEMMAS